MKHWQLQDAKNRFSQLVEAALANGPQTVTRHGHPAVVVLSVHDFRRLQPPDRINALLDSVRGLDLEATRDKSAGRIPKL